MIFGAVSGYASSSGTLNDHFAVFFSVVVYLWHLLVLPWLLLGILVNILPWLSRVWVRQMALPQAPASEVDSSRRRFLGALLLGPPMITAVTTGVAWLQLRYFRVRKMAITFAELPADLEGFKIVHVSDLHVGRFTYGDVLNQIVTVTNGLNADLVVVTGDLVNFSLTLLPEALKVVKQLKARHGVYVVEGNHDLLEDGEAFRRQVRSADCQLLADEAASLSIGAASLRIIGTRWTGGLEEGSTHEEHPGQVALVQQRLEGLMEQGAFHLLLTHHPHAWWASRRAKIPLTFAGHTHGGQLMWDEERGLGPMLFHYWSGLYEAGESALVVSNGVGNWFPLRINAPAELIEVTLKKRMA